MPAAIPDFDLYATLEVDARASREVITASWKALQKKHYPRTGDGGTEYSRRLNIAHDWLTDPNLRERYDATRMAPASPVSPAAARSAPRRDYSPPPRPASPKETARTGPRPSAHDSHGPEARTAPRSRATTSFHPVGVERLMRVPRWQRRLAAFVGAILVPVGFAGLAFRFEVGAFGSILALVGLIYPAAVVWAAMTTDRFADSALENATPMVQQAIVLMVALGLVAPAIVVIAFFPAAAPQTSR